MDWFSLLPSYIDVSLEKGLLHCGYLEAIALFWFELDFALISLDVVDIADIWVTFFFWLLESEVAAWSKLFNFLWVGFYLFIYLGSLEKFTG